MKIGGTMPLTNDHLAKMISRGFDEVHKKLDQNQKDHQEFKKQLAQHDFNMTEMVHKADYYILEERVRHLEVKMKIA